MWFDISVGVWLVNSFLAECLSSSFYYHELFWSCWSAFLWLASPPGVSLIFIPLLCLPRMDCMIGTFTGVTTFQ